MKNFSNDEKQLSKRIEEAMRQRGMLFEIFFPENAEEPAEWGANVGDGGEDKSGWISFDSDVLASEAFESAARARKHGWHHGGYDRLAL